MEPYWRAGEEKSTQETNGAQEPRANSSRAGIRQFTAQPFQLKQQQSRVLLPGRERPFDPPRPRAIHRYYFFYGVDDKINANDEMPMMPLMIDNNDNNNKLYKRYFFQGAVF